MLILISRFLPFKNRTIHVCPGEDKIRITDPWERKINIEKPEEWTGLTPSDTMESMNDV